jgi:hypothetical protein
MALSPRRIGLSRDPSVAQHSSELWPAQSNWKQLTTLNAGIKPAWGKMLNFH